jgi:STE24 endopeptidase
VTSTVTAIIKAFVATVVITMAALFVLTTLVPYPPAREEALRHFSSEEIDIGQQYAFERRLFFWANVVIEASLLGVLALTGLGRRWADHFLVWTGGRRLPAALLMGGAYFAIDQLLHFPVSVARYYHAQAWGMVNLDLLGWLRDKALATGILLGTEAIVLGGFYLLLIVMPRIWWLVAPVGGTALSVVFVFLMPIVVTPLFNDFTPLSQTEWRDQQSRVKALVDKAGVPIEEILVMNASRQSNHTNAYFAGFGSTRRIVLFDTLLKNHEPDEIESVLAHELGHWQHDHIAKGLVLGAFAALAGCFVLDRILRAAMVHAPWRLGSIADPAGVPLVGLLVVLGAWLSLPAQNAIIRHFEREADQASLILADRPDAFIRTEVKMARDNKANVAPTPWNVWLFATHPPTVERIRMAEEWKRRAP